MASSYVHEQQLMLIKIKENVLLHHSQQAQILNNSQ